MKTSLKNEPRTWLTPVKWSVPTEISPVAVPEAPPSELKSESQLCPSNVTVTPEVAW